MAARSVEEHVLSSLERAQIALEIEKLQLEIADLKMTESHQRARPSESGRFLFSSEVACVSVRTLMEELRAFELHQSETSLQLTINTPGGSVAEGLGLYDFLVDMRKRRPVTTIGLGRVASMGGVLLQAGQERLLSPHAYMLIHEVSGLTYGSTSELEDDLKFKKRMWTAISEILAERSNKSATAIRSTANRKEWWLSAEEAVAEGFADGIL